MELPELTRFRLAKTFFPQRNPIRAV